MRIRVAKDAKDICYSKLNGLVMGVYGDSVEEFYFGNKYDYEESDKQRKGKIEYYFNDTEELQELLEKDGFLTEMWNKLDALFDWYDCDYFDVEKTIKFKEWLTERLSRDVPEKIKPIYEKMLSMAEIGIEYKTGIDFDF